MMEELVLSVATQSDYLLKLQVWEVSVRQESCGNAKLKETLNGQVGSSSDLTKDFGEVTHFQELVLILDSVPYTRT